MYIKGHMLRQLIQKIKVKQAMHCVLCGFFILISTLSIQERSKHVMLQCFKCCVCQYSWDNGVCSFYATLHKEVWDVWKLYSVYRASCPSTHVSAHNFLNIQWIFNPKKDLECWESELSKHTYILILLIQVVRFQYIQYQNVLVMSTLLIQLKSPDSKLSKT